MSLVLEIPPAVTQEFSLMIQSVGLTNGVRMISAARTPLRADALPAAGRGGAIVMSAGLGWIVPPVSAPMAELSFATLWMSFGVARWLLPRLPVGAHDVGGAFGPRAIAELFGLAVIGRVVGSIIGSGLDLLVFSEWVLRFGVSERLGTPTSLILMATNTEVGAVAKAWWFGGIEPDVWRWWWTAVPVVVAPLGARFVGVQARQRVVGFLLVSIVVRFVASVVIVPADTPSRASLCAGTFLAGAVAVVSLSGAVRGVAVEGHG